MFVPKPSAGRSPSVNALRRRRRDAAALAAAGNAGACEQLEARAMMSVSVGSDGFTDIGKSSDTRTVFVSSSGGSDSNSGLSADRPVKTIKKGISLIRDNNPDHLLLKRGDTWHERVTGWSKSGRSSSEPMLFGNYGDSDDARPLLKTGTSTAFESAGSVDHLAILGIHFWAHRREPGASDFSSSASHGIRFVASTKGLLMEDIVVDQYADNILLSGYYGDQYNVKIRRSIITDSWNSSGKSQGLYATKIKGLTLEENVFDHNGWNERVSGGKATGYSHNAYITADSTNFVARRNIFSDAASHGLQARPGGEVKDNLFLRNPIHLSFGLVNGSNQTSGGVSGTVDGNVFLDTRTINGAGRGWALELGNIKGATVRNNIISDDNDDDGSPAIRLIYGLNVTNTSSGVGINNLTIEDNVVHKWTQSMSLDDGLRPGGSGHQALNNLTVRDNEFQIVNREYHKLISHWMPVNKGEESWSNNRYYEDADQKYWFGFNGDEASLSEWRSKLESTAQGVDMDYSNPDRDIVSYHRSLGGSGSFSGFVSSARKVRQGAWNSDYTARDVVNYIRAGFDRGGTSDSGGTTTPPPSEDEEQNETPPPSTSGAPTVVSYSGSATTIKIRFSEDVSGSLSATDLKLTSGSRQCYNSLRMSYDKSTNTATWTWAGYYGGTLPDGDWTAALAGSAVKDASGNSLGGGSGFSFTFDAEEGESSELTEPSVTPPPPTSDPDSDSDSDADSGSDTTRPQVVGFSGSSTSVKLKFSENVAASLQATDLSLKKVSTGAKIYSQLRLSYSSSTNEATWTWPDAGRLSSGEWQVVLPDEKFTDAAENQMAKDFYVRFTV